MERYDYFNHADSYLDLPKDQRKKMLEMQKNIPCESSKRDLQ